MENLSPVHSCPPGPVEYENRAGQKSTPLKANRFSSFDPGKAGQPLVPAAALDRRLIGDSSMGTTILVDFETFKREVLPPLPSGTQSEPLDQGKIERAQTHVMKGFPMVLDKNNKIVPPKEDQIADAVVDAINSLDLPKKYKAALSRYRADPSDDTKSKVDAGLYPEGCVPPADRPDWTHCRLYIEFKKGNVAYDPWDDRPTEQAESERSSRKKVRGQLIAYAQNIFHYQHRTALLSLFIIGEEFRAMWWDRSGVIVSKKANYYKDPKLLLEFIWHFVQLSDEQQGLDPTATLIKAYDSDFKLMNYLAQPHALDMDYLEPGTEDIVTDSPLARSATNDVSLSSSDEARPLEAQPEGHGDSPLHQVDWEKQPVFKYVRQQFRESLAPRWPRYRLEVGEEKRVFLVAKPIFKSSTMFGRATRGYVAVDVETGRFVFLKDSWRPFYKGVEPEGSYLEMFKNHKDSEMDVPTVVCHGDVGNQVAFTAGYEEMGREARKRARLEALRTKRVPLDSNPSSSANKKRANPGDEAQRASQGPIPASEDESLRHHIHYRIAVEEVCLPFSEFRTTEQLIRLMSDCIETHYWAFENHDLLHRDVSAGNVLILPKLVTDDDGVEIVEWRGILTDWELAKRVKEEDEEDAARQPERTGTWQFMSVDYIDCNWTRAIVVADELESFLHVLLYYAVRFLPNTLPSVTTFVIHYFDTFSPDPTTRERLCGPSKRSAIQSGVLSYEQKGRLAFLKTTREQGNPLNGLLSNLLELFVARYAVILHELETKTQDNSNTVPTPPVLKSTTTVTRPRAKVRHPGKPWNKAKDEEAQKETALPVYRPWMKTQAKKLDTHHEFLRLFSSALDAPATDWIDTNVAGKDQLVNYEPRVVFAAAVDAVSTRTVGQGSSARDGSAKRAKTGSESNPSAFATDPGFSASDRKRKGRAHQV
ncbi:hypothetical protein BV20DRAFT_1054162 [Pilatotrama ljubarskyi]|nr:hypothetical protein BV20DRAFT_1054162 [Pilatotrama ljubarskyi]